VNWCRRIFYVLISSCFVQDGAGQAVSTAQVLSSQTCISSGCHGGAGLNRGTYSIFKQYDPHAEAFATLSNGRSRSMARQMGVENAATSKSCTICHSPMSDVPDARRPGSPLGHAVDTGVSCASCHGPAQNWLLSHTRPDFPKDALAQLGMKPLATAYERANSCVACHQNLSDELVKLKHPPLIFELDGMLMAEPKHWREDDGFSHAKTWLVGQSVALREAAAQAKREPSGLRTAEIEALKILLQTTDTGWIEPEHNLVHSADEHAKRISEAPMSLEKTRSILAKLLADRTPFQAGAFQEVALEHRLLSVGHYAERLTLAIDRLNQALVVAGLTEAVSKERMDLLFDAAKPPVSFDDTTVTKFVSELDRLINTNTGAEPGR
jgi:Cytochrome c554 and c-prime